MINLIFQIVISLLAIYFVHAESGIATAIVAGWLLISLSVSYWLYNDQKRKISYLMNELKTNENMISELESKVTKLSKGYDDLVMYSKRHEKWLDGIDNRLPNLNFEE